VARPTPTQLEAVVNREGSNRKAAAVFGVNESTVRRWRQADEDAMAPGGQAAKTTVRGDDATILTEPTEDAPNLGDLDGLIRSRGLDPAEWVVLTTTVNEWEALAHGGGPDGEPRIVTLHQLKATLKRRSVVQLVSPAVHVPELVKPARRRRPKADRPRLVVIEGDHQAPYHDPQLDAAVTAWVADLQPDEHVFLGDGMDLPTISRHKDHPDPYFMAEPQDCINAYYDILRRRAEAAPHARRRKLKGNHDFRLEDEQLTRAERMVGIAPAYEERAALSVHRLLHLETLGVELIEDARGWQHAEVELVPGRGGLVVRHGFVTGHNTAERTLKKLGQSVIVGHDHGKESTWQLAYPDRLLLQAHVAGTMSLCNEVWPHFAVQPDWHQGCMTATIWPDGRYLVEHAVWDAGKLHWRDRRW
jgi:hypothetical protein